MIQKISVVVFIILFLNSCDNSEVNPIKLNPVEGQLSVLINDTEWVSTESFASLNDDILTVNTISENQQLFIDFTPFTGTGSYQIGPRKVAFIPTSELFSTFTSFEGIVTVTEIDLEEDYISGELSAKLARENAFFEIDSIVSVDGIFTKIQLSHR